jgi:hypothetical protein
MSRRLICFIANRRLDQADSVSRISNRRRYVIACGSLFDVIDVIQTYYIESG